MSNNNETTTAYFGPPHLMKEWEHLVEPPIGTPCLLCEEAVAQGDIGTINFAGQVTHYECSMRDMVGSVAHQLRRCSCYGGSDEEDPPEMTWRQAARLALAHWESQRSFTTLTTKGNQE
jgi:hypothetical protein